MQNALEIDFARFQRNRSNFPPEELRPYHGKHVAWNDDATAILASGCDTEDVIRQLLDRAIDPLTAVLDFIHDPEILKFGTSSS